MKAQTVKAISYCFDMISFVFQNPEAGKKIKSIYLFGSAVRGELEKSSDIDLFVECAPNDEERAKALADSGIVKFISSKDYQKWKLFHFTPPFSVQAGRSEEWELKSSISSEGILLYGRQAVLGVGERKVLFIITYPAQKKQYIRIRRLLFGRDETYYRGTGLLKKSRGEKISSTVFIVPQEYQTVMIDVLSREKIEFSMKEVTVL